MPTHHGEQLLEDTRLELTRRLREQPLRTVAMAFGMGYLLGGGLFTRLTGTLFNLGVRAALLPALDLALASRPDSPRSTT